MVTDDRESTSIKVELKFEDSPNSSKAFIFCAPVVALMSLQGSSSVRDDSFAAFLPRHDNSAEPHIDNIRVDKSRSIFFKVRQSKFCLQATTNSVKTTYCELPQVKSLYHA